MITVLICEGGVDSLSELKLSLLKEDFGEDLIICSSLGEAVEKGYIQHKHEYRAPITLKASDLLFPEIKMEKHGGDRGGPINAVLKKRKW